MMDVATPIVRFHKIGEFSILPPFFSLSPLPTPPHITLADDYKFLTPSIYAPLRGALKIKIMQQQHSNFLMTPCLYPHMLLTWTFNSSICRQLLTCDKITDALHMTCDSSADMLSP